MAKARLVCGDCGSELSAGDKFCPRCGAPIEGINSSASDTSSASETSSPLSLTCEICGQVNTHQGAYCEACGARLPGRTLTEERAEKRASQATPSRSRTPRAKSSPAGMQPWHYAAGGVLVLLLGFFVFLELGRETGTRAAAPGVPAQTEQAEHKPPQEILDAIERLERQVSENPANNGAKLLLANALHDAAMHDPRMLPRAIEAYRAYLKTTPNDPNARVDLGICYFELGKLDTTRSGSLFTMAINEMESVMKSSPKHQAGAFNLGIVYLYAGNLKESNKWFKKAVELNPESELGQRAKAILDQHAQAGR